MLTDAKRKVAETLDEFRGQWKYNLLDAHVRALNAQIADLRPVGRPRGAEQLVAVAVAAATTAATPRSRSPLLAARAAPRLPRDDADPVDPAEPGRIYRRIGYGPLLDVFFLDLRSYRGAELPAADQDRPDARASARRRRSSPG